MRFLPYASNLKFLYTLQNTAIPVKTNFSCLDKTAGFYADISADCKIYHTCDEYGNIFTYRCPEETAFRQDALICDHAHLVNCQGSIFSNTEGIRERYNNYSCEKKSVDDIGGEFLPQPLQVAQSIKPNTKVQHGFTFSSRQFLRNPNETETTKNKGTKLFHPSLSEFNSTTDVPINQFANIRTQSTASVNQIQQSGLRKEENFFIQSQRSVDKDKFMEEGINEKHYPNPRTNDAARTFWKPTSNTFLRSRNQQDDTSRNETAKNSQDGLKLSSTNHRNYPYIETLQSIQKSTKIPSTRDSITIADAFPTTTEISVYALTLSLKPLLPNEAEDDPYYPKLSTSTESYYTPTHTNKERLHVGVGTQALWSNTHLKLPSILPDLSSLEDIVDRRKLFYIPRIKFH
ncbi:uncharacterized protein LOC143369117 isoform X2 [Andrena cerasifolii]|uniref:uncharacterized protein LOC143369117 isoform X2 n=1 Tax=Andrena cerasifolii TaxID=2819439 RepID=UPI004037B1C5